MPQIIVTAGATNDAEQGTVMLRERVNESDFESERFVANLLERLGWAVEDATAAEHHVRDGRGEQPALAPAPEPAGDHDRDPEPVGVA